MKTLLSLLFVPILVIFPFETKNQYDSLALENQKGLKVEICHKGKTINVSINALFAHLTHGDIVGQCVGG